MNNDIDAIYQSTIDGILDNCRVNNLTVAASGWTVWDAIDVYNPDFDADALTPKECDALARRVAVFLGHAAAA